MEVIEIFKTNVQTDEQASCIIRHIHESFEASKANFDLEDCDRILRFQSSSGIIPTDQIIQLLQMAGFEAEVLPDEICPFMDNPLIVSSL